MSDPLRIVFFGTPQIAVPSLASLRERPEFEVSAVVTQTDKPSGRGHKLQASPVKTFALEHGIRVFQPSSLKKGERSDGLIPYLAANTFDFLVVVAYGKIIPPAVLSHARHGAVNIHFSLLPRWRGAAPLQRALLAGDEDTGIAIMKMDEGLDTGPVFVTESIRILPEHTTGSLGEILAERGAALLCESLPKIASGLLRHRPQSEEGVTYAEKLNPDDFQINWQEPAAVTLRKIQAAAPFPGAKTMYQNEPVKLYAARLAPAVGYPSAEPGTIVEANRRELIVATGKSEYLAIQELQFPSRKRLPVAEILKSKEIPKGSRFGQQGLKTETGL